MSTCGKCGTSWTSLGTSLCPVCGSKVADPAAIPQELQTAFAAAQERSSTGNGSARANGSVALKAPEELPSSSGAKEAPPLPPLRVTMFPKAERDSSDTGLPSPHGEEALTHYPISVPASLKESSTLPASARPPGGPLILGLLGLVPAALIPLTLAFESHRIAGILGFCLSGFFMPFSPIAWIVGLGAEKRRREQGLQPEYRVTAGRLLGQWSTLLLIAEATAVLILIAVLRLSGKLPLTFWMTQS